MALNLVSNFQFMNLAMQSKKCKIYLVDDDAAVRHALSFFLEGQGYEVDRFDSAESFLAAYHDSTEAVLVLDLRMGGMSGLELQAKLKDMNIGIQIIFITGHGDIQLSVMAMKAGAVSFLEKPFSNQDLLSAVEEAYDHSIEKSEMTLRTRNAQANYEALTPREQEVMRLMVQGNMNKEIAATLQVSIRTVEVHRSKVIQKMKVQSLPELVRVADLCNIEHLLN